MNSVNTPEKDTEHWANLREAGTYKGILFLLWVHKIFGRGIFSAVLVPVMAYFFCFVPVARRASREYLQYHYATYPSQWSKKPGSIDTFRHLYAFGQAILDKALAWSTPLDESEFEIADEPALKEFLERPEGQLIIGSHIGNLEYCRGFVHRYKKKIINILVYDRHSANFVNAMQEVNSDSRVNVYQVDSLDIPTILNLKAKIAAGEWLFIAGDRIPLTGEQRCVEVTFMGQPTHLPIGPYMLAKVLQCEVQLMFSYRKKSRKVYFERIPFTKQVTIPRGDKDNAALQRYAQTFASAMEKQLKEAPLQWFNFFSYWEAPTPVKNTQSPHGTQ